MSTGGLSKARLFRMHNVMAGYVERGEVPGVVTLAANVVTPAVQFKSWRPKNLRTRQEGEEPWPQSVVPLQT
jgi:hypothetical protein